MPPFLDRLAPSLRMLRRHKRFSAMAILSLGIAVALNTTMYSVLDTFVSPRIAMREPDRLYSVDYFGDYQRRVPLSDKNAAIRATSFQQDAAGMSWATEVLAERGARLREARVLTITPNYFTLLGVRPSAGRLLSEIDLAFVGNRPVVMSVRMWRQLFPEKDRFEPSAFTLFGEGREVVGLLPYEADFPGMNTDVWQLPDPGALERIALSLVRLKPGVTEAQAVAELHAVSQRFRGITGEDAQSGFRFLSATRKPFRLFAFHYALIGAVVAVLLIACANLANLQLARGVSRARELATRAAIGATRGDIVRQLLLESFWLALGGLVLGAVLTAWSIRIMDASVPPVLSEYVTHPQVSWRLVAFAVGAMLFCLILVGLAPAIRLSRVDIDTLLKSGAGTGKSKGTRRQYGLLVVAEVGLALSLLCSTTLLMKSALEIHAFRIRRDNHGLVFSFARIFRASDTDLRTRRDWSDLIVRQALAIDSVTSAATIIYRVPARRTIAVYDESGTPVNSRVPLWNYHLVSPEYLRTMRIPIVRGRDFSAGEFAQPQIIMDEPTAAKLWPGRDPIGQQIKLDSAHGPSPWLTVVGVSKRMESDWFSTDADAAEARRQQERSGQARYVGQIFVLNAHDTAVIPPTVRRGGRAMGGGEFFRVVVRTNADPRKLPLQLKAAMAEIGSTMGWAQTWEQWTRIDVLRAQHDFVASLFAFFASIALALAALGVYAIIAHMVAQRTREFGLRMAIGAGMEEIRQLVQREGNILALSGIAGGLLITAYTAKWVRAFVFSDYDRYDSRIFALASLSIFVTAWLASWVPARRAMRIDPVEALRAE